MSAERGAWDDPAVRQAVRETIAAERGPSGTGHDTARGTRGLDRDFPLLMEQARAYDFAERLGGCTDPLMAEIDAALRELWDARSYRAEVAGEDFDD